MALDLFGPASTPGAVFARPGDTRAFTAADSFFKDCSDPSLDDGTELVAAWFNQTLANMRALARGNGNTALAVPVVTEDNADDNLLLKAAQDSGTANAMVVSVTPAPAELVSGIVVRFKKSAAASTGAATLNVNGTGAKAVRRADGLPLQFNDLPASMPVECQYDLALDQWIVRNFYGNYIANGPFSSMNIFSHSNGALVCPHAVYTKAAFGSATIGATNDVVLQSGSCKILTAGRYLIFTNNVFGVVTASYSVFSMFPAAIFKNSAILQNSSGLSGETSFKLKEVGGAGTIVADLAVNDLIDMSVYQASAASASATGTSQGQLMITRVR
jgi:hypothetical protein